jgi:hypothetical protein
MMTWAFPLTVKFHGVDFAHHKVPPIRQQNGGVVNLAATTDCALPFASM